MKQLRLSLRSKALVTLALTQVITASTAFAVVPTDNDEFNQMVKQMGVAAACGMASQMAQGGGDMSALAQGAASVFCGLQPNLAGVMPSQQNSAVPFAPIQMPGAGMGGFPQGVGALAGGNFNMGALSGGMAINPGNMMPGLAGQLSLEQMGKQIVGQMAGQMVGNAINKALGGTPLGQNGLIGNVASNYAGGVATGGLGGSIGAYGPQGLGNFGSFQTPTVGQLAGAVAASAIQNKLMGNSQNGNTVAGLSVLQGSAPVVYSAAYGPFNSGGLNNVVVLPQGGINANAPITWQALNVAGGAVVDTRSYSEIRESGGVRMADGGQAQQVGYRIAGFTDENGDLEMVSGRNGGAMAGDFNPVINLREQGREDCLAKRNKHPIFKNDQDYLNGYREASPECAADRTPVA